MHAMSGDATSLRVALMYSKIQTGVANGPGTTPGSQAPLTA
jgi:hypothetical protein